MDLKQFCRLHSLKSRGLSAALALLFAASWSGCSKTEPPAPGPVKPAKSAKTTPVGNPKTTGRLLVKSNRANTLIEATRIVPADAPAPTPIAGIDEGAAEQALAGLMPGTYTVTARSPGWPDVRAEAKIEAGLTTEIAIHFKSGSLRLESLPTGATVKKSGAILGKTPLVVHDLPPGDLDLTLEYPLWPVLPFKTTITEERETAATARLPHGRLIIESVPAGATVLFSGRTLGQTPLTIERFQAGTKKLTLQSPDFPALELSVTIEDGGEVRLSPLLSAAFPLLDPAAFLRAIWVETPKEDPEKIAPAFNPTTGFRSRNGIVRNLHRRKLFEDWLRRPYRFTGTVKSYNRDTGQIEFAEQRSELSRYRVYAQLSASARGNQAFADQLTKGATIELYGKLSAVEEPTSASSYISIEFIESEPQR